MIRDLLSALAMIGLTATSFASIEEGTVLDVALDAVKIEQRGGVRTFQLSNEIMNNTVPYYPCLRGGAKFKDLRKGAKVQLDCKILDDHLVCTYIHLDDPDDSGIVTDVAKDTITIRNDQGKITTYKVTKKLVENTLEVKLYSANYPSRFEEVKPGCRIEVECFMEDGQLAIFEIEVKKDRDK